MDCYTCHRELLPVVEAALAAEGYVVKGRPRYESGTTRVTEMTRDGSMIVLREDTARDLAEIVVRTSGASAEPAVLQELARLGPAPLPGG